jgi:class 3 adenylate cyclase
VRDNRLAGDAAETYFDTQARETLDTVNLYLALVADVVKKHEGTLDKYIGDCVMAFWGAPTPNPKHAMACVRAAIDAQRAIHEVNQRRMAENQRMVEENAPQTSAAPPRKTPLPTLSLGTGVNTGAVTVGLMGSEAHIRNYTVFGREVNLADSIERIPEVGKKLRRSLATDACKRPSFGICPNASRANETLIRVAACCAAGLPARFLSRHVCVPC